jgi:hypothetical protein
MIKTPGQKNCWCTPYAIIVRMPQYFAQDFALCRGMSCLMCRFTSDGHMYISTWKSTEQTSDSVVLQGLVFLNYLLIYPLVLVYKGI